MGRLKPDAGGYCGILSFISGPYAPVPSIPDQIAERLVAWISTHSAPVPLPPERLLAATMGVNRITLRKALSRLVSGGAILRGARGSVSNPAALQSPNPRTGQASDAGMHPLQMGALSGRPPARTLSVAVYETFPGQIRFWKRVEEEYNRRAVSRKMEIVWVPATVGDSRAYADFIRGKKVSLALADEKILGHLEAGGMLSPLHPGIVQMLKGPDYLLSELVEFHDPFKSHAAPVHLGFPCIAWNRRLIGAPPSPDGTDAMSFVRWLKASAGRTPADVKLFDTPYAMVIPHGIPLGGLDGKTFKAAVGKVFSTARALGSVAGRTGMDPGYTHNMGGFRSGKAACCVAQSLILLNALPASEFPIGLSFIRPGRGACVPCSASLICAPAPPYEAEACAEFLEFLLSRQAQSVLVGELVNFSARVDCSEALAARVGLGEGAIQNMRRNFRFIGREEVLSELFLYYRLPILANQVLNGRRIDSGLFAEALAACQETRRRQY